MTDSRWPSRLVRPFSAWTLSLFVGLFLLASVPLMTVWSGQTGDPTVRAFKRSIDVFDELAAKNETLCHLRGVDEIRKEHASVGTFYLELQSFTPHGSVLVLSTFHDSPGSAFVHSDDKTYLSKYAKKLIDQGRIILRIEPVSKTWTYIQYDWPE